jgi:hypothetical protein
MLPVLPLDTSDFKGIREEGKVYVDKTPWIYRMITQGKCYFLSRPRRFGKSLTVSTLWELFSGNKELFKGLWIYDKWNFKPHPVIVFDFSSIDRKTPEILENSLSKVLRDWAEKYDVKIYENDPLAYKFSFLIEKLYQKYQTGVVVLIDEYDKPILDHLGKEEEALEIAKANRDVLKSFFGVLKGAGVVKELRFVFATGVSTFSKVSIFSDWNNLTDISMRSEFADFPGYTEEEILKFFKPHLEAFAREKGVTPENIMEELRFWYNGYRFSPYKNIRIYNPISVMNALAEKFFRNYWFETGTPSFLVRLLKNRLHTLPELEALKVDLDVFKAFELENLPVEAILYQAGYLTIKEVRNGLAVLCYPNKEVKESFSKVLLVHLSGNTFTARALVDDLGQALRDERFEEVTPILNEILAEIPYTLFTKADERLFHVIFYLTLNILGYHVEAELLTHRGRLDMMVRYPDKIFIFEFKAGASAEKAIAQIKEKGYHERFLKEGKPIYLFGVSFDPEERKVKEVKWEKNPISG